MSQHIIIVDEHDHEIGSADRESIVPGDQRIFRTTGLWITNSQGNILLAQRAFTKSIDPGKWSTAVSGTLEVGETYQSNITKEAKEELGLERMEFQLGPKLYLDFKHQPDFKYCVFAQWFFLTADMPASEFKIQKEEVERVCWFERNELARRIQTHPHEFQRWVSVLLEYQSQKKE